MDQELVRANARLSVVAEVSRAFAAAVTSYPRLLARIARTAADLVGDGCMVTLIAPDGETLVNAANAHRDPELGGDYAAYLAKLGVMKTTSAAVSAGVIRTGEPKLVHAVDPADMVARADDELKPIVARLNVHSFVVVPIRAHGAVIGSLSLLRSRPGCGYTADDLTLLQDVADRAGLAIDNARHYDELERRVGERTVELEAVNRELEAFTYSVAHDLRAPLRAVDGFSQALMEDCGDRISPEGVGHLTRIRSAAKHMGVLIDALLNLSRLGRAELRRERVDLTEIARSVLARLRDEQPDREVEIAVEPGLAASGDARLLEVVLTNLLGNAWKFTRKRAPARIEFAARSSERPPVYVVRDNGAGFDPTHAGKLFGVFQRLHHADEFEGTGIGLATVQRIVHRHGGRVWGEGEPERGATFYFTLEADRAR